MDRMLTSEEAARRLGVKVSTLYAYVSRGLLGVPAGPVSPGQPLRSGPGRGAGGPQPGRAADGHPDGHHHDGRDPAQPGARARSTGAAWPPSWRGSGDSKTWPSCSGSRRVAAIGAAPDLGPCPLDGDLRPHALGARGVRRQRSAPLRSSAARGGRPRRGGPPLHWPTWSARPPPGAMAMRSIAARLAARLTGTTTALPEAAVNAALVLLADHELATSTMAVRIAASVRADPYDAFLAGLVTLAGPAARRREPAGLRVAGHGGT